MRVSFQCLCAIRSGYGLQWHRWHWSNTSCSNSTLSTSSWVTVLQLLHHQFILKLVSSLNEEKYQKIITNCCLISGSPSGYFSFLPSLSAPLKAVLPCDRCLKEKCSPAEDPCWKHTCHLAKQLKLFLCSSVAQLGSQSVLVSKSHMRCET